MRLQSFARSFSIDRKMCCDPAHAHQGNDCHPPRRCSLKNECVYLHAWSGGRKARASIGAWMDFYNHRRPHSALGGRTPHEVYCSEKDQGQPGWQARHIA
jgi:transposase InsO family protein